jgi:hypothetical protein
VSEADQKISELKRQLAAERERGQALERQAREARARTLELEHLINAPEIGNFLEGVRLEAAHQVERWGADHDEGKDPASWFWLLGYLAGKALAAAIAGDLEKALHHTISTAAACLNWHARLTGTRTAMRPGIAPPA